MEGVISKLRIVIAACLIMSFTVLAFAQKLSATAEALIPDGAERVAVSEGNLTLRSDMSLEELNVFYDSATKNVKAEGVVTRNPLMLIEEEGLKWKWIGKLNGKDMKVSIYLFDDEEEDIYTIVVTY